MTDQEFRRIVADRIKHARRSAGLSQVEAAGKAGMAASQLARYETGENEPQIATLRRLAKALEVSISELIGE